MSLLVASPCFYAEHGSEPADLMMQSAHNHGLSPILIGVGQPLGNPHGADMQGYRALEFFTGREESHVLMVDCLDVLFFAGEREFMEGYAKLGGKGVVVSAEQSCWPPNPEALEGMPKNSPFGYNNVNIGCYIGERRAVCNMLKVMLDKIAFTITGGYGVQNPQAWLPLAMVRGLITDVVLDHNCELFQCMGGPGCSAYIRNRRIYNPDTNTEALLVHYNGQAGDRKFFKGVCKELL